MGRRFGARCSKVTFCYSKKEMPLLNLPADVLDYISGISEKQCDDYREIDVLWGWGIVNVPPQTRVVNQSKFSLFCDVRFRWHPHIIYDKSWLKSFARIVAREVRKTWPGASCRIAFNSVHSIMNLTDQECLLMISFPKLPKTKPSWGTLAAKSWEITQKLAKEKQVHVWPLAKPEFATILDPRIENADLNPPAYINPMQLTLRFRTCPKLRLVGGTALKTLRRR